MSHSALDRHFVEREIVALLQQHGIDTWYAPSEIASASQWERSIIGALDLCEWFLVVLTANSISSQWVHREIHWAADERPNRIVPVLAEDCDWKKGHLILRTIQLVDFRRPTDDAKKQLLQVFGIQFDAREATVIGALRAATERGDPEAQFSLARRCEMGKGVRRNEVEAARLYLDLAERGYAPAQVQLARCYESGRGVPRNDKEAARWCQEAATQGSADGQYLLGVFYFYGIGVQEDQSKATHWIRKAAQQGHPAALKALKG